MSEGYDFGTLYGMADHSAARVIPEDSYDAIVEDAAWGKTKDGTKGAWTVKFRITTGPEAGYPLTMTMSVSPNKNDGTSNERGLGRMFRQLAAMGIPVPPGQAFWELGWSPENVAQAMKGKPVLIKVIQDEYDGDKNNKVRDIRPPKPGAPLQVQQAQQAQQAPAGQWQAPQNTGYAQAGGGYQGYGQPQPQPNGYPQQPQGQPGYGYPGQQQAPQGPVAPGPWQNAQPQPGQPQQPPQQVPGTPTWAQPAQPGQGGQGEFTAQGQSFQGHPGQQFPNGQPQTPPQGYGAPATGAPAPGAQVQPGAPSPSSPQQGQQDPGQQQGAPNLPPWAS